MSTLSLGVIFRKNGLFGDLLNEVGTQVTSTFDTLKASRLSSCIVILCGSGLQGGLFCHSKSYVLCRLVSAHSSLTLVARC
jgi:hypothetical protein